MKIYMIFIIAVGLSLCGCANSFDNSKKQDVDTLIKTKVASLGPEYNQPRILNNLSPELFQPGFPKDVADSLNDYTFYKITLYFDKNGESRLLAFNKTSDKLFLLPKEVKDLHFPQHDNPIIMGKIYTILVTPPADGMVFINSKDDIDGIDNTPDVQRMVTEEVVEPAMIKYAGGTDVILYTWQKIGGIIKKWRIRFSEDGVLESIDSKPIAEQVGRYAVRY